MELNNKSVTKKTYDEITSYVYENKEKLSNEEKLFYSDIKGFIHRELKKKKEHRMTMDKIIKTVQNMKETILNSGAISYDVEFI